MDTNHGNPEGLLAFMNALADPSRLRLLRLLERHELGVAELCDVVQMPQSTVSRHLKVLADQGFVRSRADGTNRLYRMPPAEDVTARRLWLLARERTEAWPTARQDRLRLTRLAARRRPAALAFFAGAAGRWDRLRTELYGDAFTECALLSLLPPTWVIADLGCGSGHATARLAPYVRGVIGVDQSAAMLKAARRRTAGLRNVDLRQGSLEALPIEDGAADGALLLLALTYVAEPRRVLEELARVLRPGGRAVVVDLLRHDREEFRRQLGQSCLGFEAEQLEAMLREAGLEQPATRALPPEPGAKGPALLLATAMRPGRAGEIRNQRVKREERKGAR
jgi:ArsR family transcriptional regulator